MKMAFQRPFLISLKRKDSQRWGFGIAGGKEYGEPLRIQTVAEDSIAERCGLHEGDEIIQVGRVNVQDFAQGQAYELLARCGNKIEMFVVREDLLAQRKGKEPPTVKAVVHNPYNSPMQLYSTENVAETLAQQTEVLTEGRVLTEEEDEEGPENLSFKQKSAVFQLLEEQAKQETEQNTFSRGSPQRQSVVKPKTAPPPPPKPKPPAQEHLYNGYDTTQRQAYQDQQKTSRVEYQTTQKVVNQYQYQQEQPIQYQQSTVYQTSSTQKSPVIEKNYSPGYQSQVSNYQQKNNQQSYQQGPYQSQSPQSPTVSNYQQYSGYQSPPYDPLNQLKYQQSPNTGYQQTQQNRGYQQTQQNRGYQQTQNTGYQQTQNTGYQQTQNTGYQQTQNAGYQQPQGKEYRIQIQTQTSAHSQKEQQSPTTVSKAEFKIGPPPPPRGTPKQDQDNMTAIYRQQYEHHLQQQHDQQQQFMNHIEDVGSPPKAHIVKDNIFEHNSTSGTPITYKAPPAAPAKPNWPPPPSPEQFRHPAPTSPTNMSTGSAWPPKKSTVTDLPRTGFNPAAVREQGNGRKCVWPPIKPEDEYRSGRSTPQSPVTGRRIQWNPSPSPPTNRKAVFGASQSPVRRKDIQWPPASPTSTMNGRESYIRESPRLSRKARFEDYIREHASINVPQTYRPPPGTQHVEYRYADLTATATGFLLSSSLYLSCLLSLFTSCI